MAGTYFCRILFISRPKKIQPLQTKLRSGNKMNRIMNNAHQNGNEPDKYDAGHRRIPESEKPARTLHASGFTKQFQAAT
jgi:hypothetical protein